MDGVGSGGTGRSCGYMRWIVGLAALAVGEGVNGVDMG